MMAKIQAILGRLPRTVVNYGANGMRVGRVHEPTGHACTEALNEAEEDR